MNCRKLSLTIQQNVLGEERDRCPHVPSNHECPFLQAFRRSTRKGNQGSSEEASLGLRAGERVKFKFRKQQYNIDWWSPQPQTPILITNTKEFSSFWELLFWIILDLVFECFNREAYPAFTRSSQSSSCFSFILLLFLLPPNKHSGTVLGTGDIPVNTMKRFLCSQSLCSNTRRWNKKQRNNYYF